MNFEAAAVEAFRILRSYDYEVVLYDDEGNKVFEPEEARRFFAKPENLLVSIVDDGDDSGVRLFMSKSTDINSILGMVDALRSMATKYKMIFHLRKYDKVLSPRDFSTRASVTEDAKEGPMKILEGMYGTSRSSYLKLENARMIVRHSARVDENLLGARGRNVDNIYIENGVGERFLFPTKQLAPARAMTHHVSHGGNWADPVGEQICRMAKDFANLMSASRHIYICSEDLQEGAQEVRNTIRESVRSMRKVFENICRKTRYDEAVEALSEKATTLNENSDFTQQIDELAKLCNCEKRSLDENVLRSVAEALAEDKRMKDGGASKNAEYHNILGTKVNKLAWEDFKKGILPLNGKVELSSIKFKGLSGQLSHYMSEIAKLCKDDSMSNLLSRVGEELVDPRPMNSRQHLRLVADKAMAAAGLAIKSDTPKAEAVKEFAEWMDSFTTSRVLNEMGIDPHSRMARDADSAAEAVEAAFDPAEFVEWCDYYGNEELTPDDVKRSVEAYLDHLCERDFECTNVNNSYAAKSLLPKAVEYMKANGFTINQMVGEDEFDDEEVDGFDDGAELSSEDILLPKSGKEDLMGEVQPATVTDPQTGNEVPPDDGYINRLQALAGMNKRHI